KIEKGTLPEANVDGSAALNRRFNGVTGFEVVGGNDDVEVVDRPQRSQVMQRVVRRAERTVAHAGTDTDQLHRMIGIGDVVLDLLERPGGQEACGRNRV